MEGVPGGERPTDRQCVSVCGCRRRWWSCSSTGSGGYPGPPHSGTYSFPTGETHQNWMKILIIQCQISQRKLVFWNDKAKINATSPPLYLSFTPHLLMRVWRRKAEGGWSGSAYVALSAPLFAPPLSVGASVGLRSSRVDISFVPASPRCYSVNPPEAAEPLQPAPPPDWVRGEETPRWGRCKSQWGCRGGGGNRPTCTSTCMQHNHVSTHTHTQQKPSLWHKQAAHAFETKTLPRHDRVSIVRLRRWVNRRTARANYHLCVRLSGEEHSHCTHVWVCVCVFSFQNVRRNVKIIQTNLSLFNLLSGHVRFSDFSPQWFSVGGGVY